MSNLPSRARRSLIFCAFLVLGIFFPGGSYAQGQKKVRMSVSSTTVALLPIFAAFGKGFYQDEGIDLEIILMPATLASTAVLTGNIEYNGAVSGVIGAAVRDRPIKVLLFTVARPLLFLMSKKEIKHPRELRGKKVAGSSPGGSATLLAYQALRHFGLEPGRDVSVLPMGGTAASRFAVLESGAVDASILSVPENIFALEKGYNELIFLGEIVEFPQTGIGTSEKRIRENPEEVYRMVRALVRGLMFLWDKDRYEEILDLTMKRWKLNDRRVAAEMFRHVSRVLTKDASVKPESVQVLIDLAREGAKVTRPVKVAEVVDYSFVEKARKELGLMK